MQVETKKTKEENDPATKVISKFGREDDCIGCSSRTYLQETCYDKEKDGILGHYKCKCGWKQSLIVTGAFVYWYREAIMNEDLAEVKLVEKKNKEEEETKRLEALQLPEVKIG